MNKKIIDYEALNTNLKYYKNKKVCAMVKANAYGHGQKEIVSYLKDKVDYFGVSSFEEGESVRDECDNKILIASKVFNIEKCKQKKLEFIVDDIETLKECEKKKCLDLVHIKINTGMNRFGFDVTNKKNLKELRIFLKENSVTGVATHFSDLDDRKKTISQYNNFCKIKNFLKIDCLTHFGGGKIIDYNFDYDMVRVGLGLYLREKKVMKIFSKIIEIKNLNDGEVGYNGKHKILKPTKVALLPIGYADGLSRRFSGCNVLVNGEECKIIGNICMDLCFIDISNVKCEIGDEVEILHNIKEYEKKGNTIPYEILTGFNKIR